MIKKQKIILVSLLMLFIFFIVIPTVHAAIVPKCASEGAGTTELTCFMELIINIGRFLLGIAGSLALIFLLYGSFLWLTSGGSTEKITQGKKVIIGAIIGLAIVFTAGIIVNFVVKALGAGTEKYPVPASQQQI